MKILRRSIMSSAKARRRKISAGCHGKKKVESSREFGDNGPSVKQIWDFLIESGWAYDACDDFGIDSTVDDETAMRALTKAELMMWIYDNDERYNNFVEYFDIDEVDAATRIECADKQYDDDWFVIDDTRSSRFYDFETMDEAKRLARYYNKKYNNTLSIRDELKKSRHSTAFINEVLFQASVLKEQGADRPDPYDLALKYFDEAYSDSEIENDLRKQGYSDEFIQRVFDKLDDVYQK